MKAMYRFTRKNLIQNKHRTIVTLIGVALTSVLLFSVGFILTISKNRNIAETKLSVGLYHFVYEKVDKDVVKQLQGKDFLDKIEIETVLHEDKKIILYGRNSYALSNLTLLQGDFPKNSQEVVVNSQYLRENHKKIGDIILLDEHKYKIIGVYESNYYSMEKLYTYSSQVQEKSNVYITLKNPKNAYQKIHDLSNSLGFKEYHGMDGIYYEHEIINSSLLKEFGEYRTELDKEKILLILIIFLTVLSFTSIFVVYNAFAISVTERKKTLGVLSSIGATPTQLLKSVFYEATLITLIGIPIGFLLSWFGSSLVVYILNTFFYEVFDIALQVSIYPNYLFVCLIFILVTIYLSAFFPAMRAREVTPLEAIRMSQDIKMKKKNLKSGKWVRRIFGIEGEIAYKNKKRNKKKYRIVNISLFIAIVLFMTFSAFLDLQRVTIKKDYESLGTNYDTSISISGDKETQEAYISALFQDIKIDEMVEESSFLAQLPDESRDLLSSDYQKRFSDIIRIRIYRLRDDVFNDYLKRLGYSEKKPIFVNKVRYGWSNNNYVHEFSFLNEFTELKLYAILDRNTMFDFEITDYYMTDFIFNSAQYLYPTLYVSEELYDELLGKTENEIFLENATTIGYQIVSKDNRKLNKRYEDLKKQFPEIDVFYNSPSYEQYERLLELKVQNYLVLGAIILLALISITSVLNTIYTSMQLRKKEFAMLRSIGMCQKSFYKMISLESIFFAFQSLLFGIVVSTILIKLFHTFLNMGLRPEEVVKYPYPYTYLVITIIGVFLIVFLTMLYSIKKLKNDNIIDTLKEDSF